MRISDWSSDVCSSDLGRYLAAAPLEDKFWENFTRIIGLVEEFRAPSADAKAAIAAVARIIADKTAGEGERSEERRVGKEWGRPCRYRSSLEPYKKNEDGHMQYGTHQLKQLIIK